MLDRLLVAKSSSVLPDHGSSVHLQVEAGEAIQNRNKMIPILKSLCYEKNRLGKQEAEILAETSTKLFR